MISKKLKTNILIKREDEIKNIIFDLGGVIVNINYRLTLNAFKEIGIHNIEELYTQYKQSNLFDGFETGKISAHDFRKGLIGNEKITDETFDNAWGAMLLDTPIERINLLQNLKKKYRIFLLSNINEIHIEQYHAKLMQQFGSVVLYDVFEKVYYSNEIHMRKPDAEIYRFVMEEQGIIPQETIFIDDLPQNVAGALTTGLRAYQLQQGESITDLFIE